MKIILLSDANSIHSLRWVKALKDNNINLLLFSFFKPNKKIKYIYDDLGVEILSPDLKSKINKINQPNISKIKYIYSITHLMRAIRVFKPDLINSHYASSYGLLGALSMFKPFVLSVWGSDIYDFPYISNVNRHLMRFILKRPDFLCSTSIAMKNIIQKEYMRNDVEVIPFGIDIDRFKPSKLRKKNFIVGIIKSIEEHNGIDCLLDAAKIINFEHKKNIEFLIIGKGSLEKEMKNKTKNLGLEKKVKFLGFIDHSNILEYHQKLSVLVVPSIRESFGVSVLESAACGIPSITSNVGGLTEVNLNDETGLVIEPNDPIGIANAILKLHDNEKLRNKMGENARKRVVKKFNWIENSNKMINIYKKINENS